MNTIGILLVATVIVIKFALDLWAKPDKPSPEEALGKAIGKYLESGIRIKKDKEG